MPDFLDRYGAQLHAAQQQRSKRRRSRILRRGTIASLVVVAIAAPAIAVVEPWNPKLGRPKIDGKISVDRSPVQRSAVDVLAVLRRPQTARDRKLAAPRLRNVGGRMKGVQVDAIRAVSPNYALVPITTLDDGQELGPLLCLLGGGAASCSRTIDVDKHGVTALSGGPKGTHFAGVVPDGVVRVRFSPDGGTPVESGVRDNFYEIRVPEHGPASSVPPPKGYTGPTRRDGRLAMPSGPASGRLEWFDADGKVVGPEE